MGEASLTALKPVAPSSGRLAAAFSAQAATAVEDRWILIGGRRVRLRFGSPGMLRLMESFAHLSCEPRDHADLHCTSGRGARRCCRRWTRRIRRAGCGLCGERERCGSATSRASTRSARSMKRCHKRGSGARSRRSCLTGRRCALPADSQLVVGWPRSKSRPWCGSRKA